VSFQGIFLDTLVTGWLGYSSLENSLVVGGDFGTAAKYFRRNFTAPIHPPSGRRFRSFCLVGGVKV
jgi:hypothetical protein